MLDSIFGPKKAVIGMVHLPPLPGAPLWKGATQDEILDFALQDAINLAAGGVSALIVENQNDQPFFTGSVPLLTVTCMTAARFCPAGCHQPGCRRSERTDR